MKCNSIKRWGIFGATLALLAAPGCGKETESPQGPDAAVSHDSSGNTDRGSSDTPAPNSAVLMLKQEELALTDGRSADITLDIPEGVVSITLSVVGQAGVRYGICKWTSPDGILIKEGWQSENATACPSCANYLRTHERVFAVVAPNNPAATVGPGAHLLSICASEMFGSSSSKVRFAAYVKVLPAPPATGILDLNLHFTGAKGLDAKQAKDDPGLKAALLELGQIFGQVGITIGEVTWSDVNSGFQVLEVMENIEDMFGEVFKLFAEAAGPNAAGVDLFFIDHFTGPGATLGWSGGIPGPPLVHGLEGSGVAIALTKLPDSKLSLGQVMAHELGHFLGLFHTGEAVKWLADPLPDTPEHDASYLMYFAPEGIKLSEWQGRVLRSSPWIKH